jgi:hypothetical protein
MQTTNSTVYYLRSYESANAYVFRMYRSKVFFYLAYSKRPPSLFPAIRIQSTLSHPISLRSILPYSLGFPHYLFPWVYKRKILKLFRSFPSILQSLSISYSLIWSFSKTTNYEPPNYEVFSSLLLLFSLLDPKFLLMTWNLYYSLMVRQTSISKHNSRIIYSSTYFNS